MITRQIQVSNKTVGKTVQLSVQLPGNTFEEWLETRSISRDHVFELARRSIVIQIVNTEIRPNVRHDSKDNDPRLTKLFNDWTLGRSQTIQQPTIDYKKVPAMSEEQVQWFLDNGYVVYNNPFEEVSEGEDEAAEEVA